MDIASDCVQPDYRPNATEQDVIARLSEELATSNRLRGNWSTVDRLVVVQLLDTQLIRSWQRGTILCMPYGWAGGNFGGSLTLTVSLKGTEKKLHSFCRASIFMGDPILAVIRDEPFTLVVVNGKQIVRCDRIDYIRTQNSRSSITTSVDSVNKDGARAWLDEDSNFWETLFHHTMFHKYMTAAEQLSIGWFERQKSSYHIPIILRDLKDNNLRNTVSNLSLNEDALGFVDALEGCDGDFRIVRDFFLERFESNLADALTMFISQFAETPDDEEHGFALGALRAILQAFFEWNERCHPPNERCHPPNGNERCHPPCHSQCRQLISCSPRLQCR